MKKYTWTTFSVLTLCLMLCVAGCSAKSASYDEAAPAAVAYSAAEVNDSGEMVFSMAEEPSAMMERTDAAPQETEAGNQQPLDQGVRKIIYQADMTVVCDKPTAMLDAIIAKTQALGGYVGSSYTKNNEDGTAVCTVTLKVPYLKLDTLTKEAKALGTVMDYQLTSDDISGSYYDIAARLSAAKAEEKQLTVLLEKCETVEDMLKVRESLSAVRSDIESYQGRINMWDELVAYATLNLTIRQSPKTAVAEESKLIELWKAQDVWGKMQTGFANSARFVVNALGAVGIFLAVALIPGGILFACIGVPIILHHRKKKRAAAKKDIAADEEQGTAVKAGPEKVKKT